MVLFDKGFSTSSSGHASKAADVLARYGDFLLEGRPNANGYEGPSTHCVATEGGYGDTGENNLANWTAPEFTFKSRLLLLSLLCSGHLSNKIHKPYLLL